MPVESISTRFRMGMVQMLGIPANLSFASISATSSSVDWRSGMRRRNGAFMKPGIHEYHLRFSGHSGRGFRRTVVSTMEKGAMSVEVSARPALPKTRSTWGKAFSRRSCSCRTRAASVTEMPGRAVGM
jgi:hypothetical protein